MSLRDRILDLTVFYSFERTGFQRHRACFRAEDTDVDLRGKTCLVTGANKGIGYAAALALAQRNADVWLLCRDPALGSAARDAIRRETGNDRVFLERLDVSELADVRAFASRFSASSIDVLVHNAGVFLARRTETREGHELSFATNILGPFLLTHLLVPKLVNAPAARVIHVSSGGMYLRRLAVGDAEWTRRPYDGIGAYVEAKRAQVVLSEMWAERFKGSPITVSSMHPGWADTPGVRSSLPRFFALMKDRLRTSEEGADTIVWLAAAPAATALPGRFWFDRAPQPTHIFPWTHETPGARRRLWELCASLASVPADTP
jgi:NAD(P)-dependent dehydrogenase (short-subunit alcohol dehydrogenase family)